MNVKVPAHEETEAEDHKRLDGAGPRDLGAREPSELVGEVVWDELPE